MFGIPHVLLATAVCNSLGSHVARKEAPGKVTQLVTLGAPAVSWGLIKKPDGGCWRGYRIVARSEGYYSSSEDKITKSLDWAGYDHPAMETLTIAEKGFHSVYKCGEDPWRMVVPSLWIHAVKYYETFAAKLDGTKFARVKKDLSMVAGISYEKSWKLAGALATAVGFNLVGSTVVGDDSCHLVQDPRTKRCVLTFEGSDNMYDFGTDAALVTSYFCDLPTTVHLGFRNELRRVINADNWQKVIRPKLRKCSEVDAVGHSLGGAVASLFTMCIEYANGSEDYKNMSWTQSSSPEAMTSFHREEVDEATAPQE